MAVSGAISSGALATGLGGIGLGTVLGASSVFQTLSDETTTSTNSNNLGLIIGVSVAGVVLLIGVVVAMICCLRRRAKVVEEIMSHEDEIVVQEKESIEKENNHFVFSGSEGQELPNESEIKIKNNKTNSNVLKVHELGDNSEILDN